MSFLYDVEAGLFGVCHRAKIVTPSQHHLWPKLWEGTKTVNARLACTGAVAVWCAPALSTCGGTLAVYWCLDLCARATAGGVGIRCLLALCSGEWVFAGGYWVEPVRSGASIIGLHHGAIWALDEN